MPSQIKILIVDDEDDILEFLSYNLIKDNYKVFTASDGQEGLRQAELHRPDLIVLDIMMPKLDGVQVCKRLRANPNFEDTIIVFLTASGEDFTQITALDQGGDDFIQKPVKMNVFKSRIKALLRRKLKTGLDQMITLGNLIIDPDKYMVEVDGNKVILARKEFDLLYYLASKPGRVFKRQEILNAVWGSDVIVGSRTIDVHIRKLREKINDQLIKTIKGVGYKIDI